jgi:hypothetical protein
MIVLQRPVDTEEKQIIKGYHDHGNNIQLKQGYKTVFLYHIETLSGCLGIASIQKNQDQNGYKGIHKEQDRCPAACFVQDPAGFVFGIVQIMHNNILLV